MKPVDTTIVGGGMITNDLILPSVYHLQRTGIAGTINICALNNAPLKALAANPDRSDAYYVLGQLYRELPGVISFGNVDAAVSFGRKAVDLREAQVKSGA